MLKIKDLIKKLEQFDENTEIKIQINDRDSYNEIYSIIFNTWVNNEFDDEVILVVDDDNE